jgi:hypothetical protein
MEKGGSIKTSQVQCIVVVGFFDENPGLPKFILVEIVLVEDFDENSY